MELYHDAIRREAIITLLAMPDSFDLRSRVVAGTEIRFVYRKYRYTCPSRLTQLGKDELKWALAKAYLQHRQEDAGRDLSCVISLRKNPRLKVAEC